MQTKSLEELAIIVEVLEEDLKTCQSYRSSNKRRSSLYRSEYEEKFRVEDSPQHFIFKSDQENELPLSPSYSVCSDTSPGYSSSGSYPSPVYNQGADAFFMNQAAYGIYEIDDHRYDDQFGMSYSLVDSCEHQVSSLQKSFFSASSNREDYEVSPQKMKFQEEWRTMTFFWAQTEREEALLNDISDRELLAADENGRT